MNHREYMKELLKMSNEAIKRALGSKRFHRDLAEKYVNGKEFTLFCGIKIDTPFFINKRYDYIEIKNTIRIGDYDVPEPYRQPVHYGNVYYTFMGDMVSVTTRTWEESQIDQFVFSKNCCFKTPEDAQLAKDAILSLLKP